jgi:hypothetical protein
MSICLPARRAAQPRWLQDPLWTRARMVPSLDLRMEDALLRDAVSGQRLVTFTRASTGTYIGSDGLVKTAATNLLVWSEDASQWLAAPNLTVTTNQTTAPDGASTADRYLETSSTSPHTQDGSAFTFVAGTLYTYSAYVKSINSRNFEIGFPLKFTDRFAKFNLSTGAVQSVDGAMTAGIQALANGWFRCWATSTCVIDGGARVGNFVNNELFSRSYAGNTSNGIFIWGAQLEEGSTATEYLPTGATINSAPRITHDPTTGRRLGLLVEEARTNLLLQSEDFATTWTNVQSSDNTNVAVAPDGTTTADALVDTVNSAPHNIGQNVAGLAGSTNYTFSCYMKKGSKDFSALIFNPNASWGTGNAASAYFDLVNGTVSTTSFATATIQALPNGWYRCTATALTAASPGTVALRVASSLTGNTQTYTGVGDEAIYVWGAQLEVGSLATSYIPTTTTAVTRAADIPTITSGLDTSRIRTLYAEFASPASGARGIVSLNDNSANNRFGLSTSGTDPLAVAVTGGVSQASIDAGTVTADQISKLAARFNADDFAASFNGGAEVIDTSGTMPTVDRIMLGRSQANEYLNGPITRLIGWDRLVYNTQELTR